VTAGRVSVVDHFPFCFFTGIHSSYTEIHYVRTLTLLVHAMHRARM
jgi:hypothetical protein